jgi:hypothetical protein
MPNQLFARVRLLQIVDRPQALQRARPKPFFAAALPHPRAQAGALARGAVNFVNFASMESNSDVLWSPMAELRTQPDKLKVA